MYKRFLLQSLVLFHNSVETSVYLEDILTQCRPAWAGQIKGEIK